jgi:hypothetical protein
MYQRIHIQRNAAIKNKAASTVAHFCNPSYLEDRDQEVCGSRPVPENIKTSSQPKELGMVIYAYHPSCTGCIHGRTAV